MGFMAAEIFTWQTYQLFLRICRSLTQLNWVDVEQATMCASQLENM